MSPDLFRVYSPAEAGSDDYPFEWHATIKHAVRERAGFRCVRCHHPYRNGEHGKGEWSPCDESCTHYGPLRAVSPGGVPVDVPPAGFRADGEVAAWAPWRVEAQWRVLTVHHLDGDKLNCRWWNLAALCQRCHLTIQGKVRMDRTWPWAHSEWFRVFVAGFYASYYLSEELSREEVESRLAELLALEFVG